MKSKELNEKLADVWNKLQAPIPDPKENPQTDNDLMGLSKMGDQLTDIEKILFLSDVSLDIANKFSLLFALDTKLKSPILREYLIKNLSLRVSKDRKGRSEMIKLANSISVGLAVMMGSGNQEKKSFKDKLTGALNKDD